MRTEADFLAGVRDAPDDRGLLEAYADFLRETGRPERAELITVQLHLAGRAAGRQGPGRKRLAELGHTPAVREWLTPPGFLLSPGSITLAGRSGLSVRFHHPDPTEANAPVWPGWRDVVGSVWRLFVDDGLVRRAALSSLRWSRPSAFANLFGAHPCVARVTTTTQPAYPGVIADDTWYRWFRGSGRLVGVAPEDVFDLMPNDWELGPTPDPDPAPCGPRDNHRDHLLRTVSRAYVTDERARRAASVALVRYGRRLAGIPETADV
jgi:uncharacterized protein (TIGR02996 family)